MGPRQLVAVVLLLIGSRFSDAKYLQWNRPIHLEDDAQKPADTIVVEELQKELPMESSQKAARFRSKQTVNAVTPFSWKFPDDPVDVAEPNPTEKFELNDPVPSTRYAVRCGESDIQIELYMDQLGLSKWMNPEDLTLGGCSATEVDESSRVLIFKSELHGCGSNLTITEDSLIYAFKLVYKPQGLGDFITRSWSAVIRISCQYPRTLVSSSAFMPSQISYNAANSFMPSWMSHSATKVAEEQLYFSLRLMTDDWVFERPSNRYLLGDFLNIEALVMQYKHVPLQVFIDSCVATLEPDDNAVPRYSFIMNHGCLVDSKITGSSSQFMPRSQEDKLQFQLEAFKFLQQQNNSLIYITCQLKATPASSPRSSEHKACSFKMGWEMHDEDDELCRCCESTCVMRKASDVTAELRQELREAKVILGPIDIQEE